MGTTQISEGKELLRPVSLLPTVCPKHPRTVVIELMIQEIPFVDMQDDVSFTSSEIIELIHYSLCMPDIQW